jgi:hypothetical protein
MQNVQPRSPQQNLQLPSDLILVSERLKSHGAHPLETRINRESTIMIFPRHATEWQTYQKTPSFPHRLFDTSPL